MIVYDELGNALDAEALDYAKGYLTVRKRIHHHPAVEAAAETGHMETLEEYPATGGRDVRWVVDTPGADSREAWDEEETYTEYVRYTEEELAEQCTIRGYQLTDKGKQALKDYQAIIDCHPKKNI